jgi:hypothetical protein
MKIYVLGWSSCPATEQPLFQALMHTDYLIHQKLHTDYSTMNTKIDINKNVDFVEGQSL